MPIFIKLKIKFENNNYILYNEKINNTIYLSINEYEVIKEIIKKINKKKMYSRFNIMKYTIGSIEYDFLKKLFCSSFILKNYIFYKYIFLLNFLFYIILFIISVYISNFKIFYFYVIFYLNLIFHELGHLILGYMKNLKCKRFFLFPLFPIHSGFVEFEGLGNIKKEDKFKLYISGVLLSSFVMTILMLIAWFYNFLYLFQILLLSFIINLTSFFRIKNGSDIVKIFLLKNINIERFEWTSNKIFFCLFGLVDIFYYGFTIFTFLCLFGFVL